MTWCGQTPDGQPALEIRDCPNGDYCVPDPDGAFCAFRCPGLNAGQQRCRDDGTTLEYCDSDGSTYHQIDCTLGTTGGTCQPGSSDGTASCISASPVGA
jgi:hypothetical protein